MILVRDDVSFFINNDYTQYFRNMECPDEHYFINLFIIFRKKFIKQQINFCNPILERTQAIEFNYISKKMLEQIKGAGFLFMRKIKKNTIFE